MLMNFHSIPENIQSQFIEDFNEKVSHTSEPKSLEINFYKCMLCSKKYGNLHDIEDHLTNFHSIAAACQKKFIESDCFS